jgi:hypothetical protein
MGRTFWPSAVGVDESVVAALGRRALVAEHPDSSFSGRREFSFKHALTHEVAYASLPRADRRELHRRVADWIASVMPDRQAETAELLAYHLEEAVRHGDRDRELEQRAFDTLLVAGDAAIRRGAFATAGGMLGRALELAPGRHEASRALYLAARVDVAESRYERALGRLDEVLATGAGLDAAARADALGLKARASWLRGSWRDALASSEAALQALDGEPESAELARALARLSQIQMLRALPGAEETARRAIEVARATGEAAAEANARTNLLTIRARDVAPGRDELDAIVALASSAGAYDETARVVVNYLWSAWLYEPLDRVEEAVEEAARRVTRGLGTESYALYLQLSLGVLVYVPAGRWEEAARLEKLWRPSASASNRLVWLWLVSGIALRRGDLARVDELLPEFHEMAFASEEPQRILPLVTVAMPRALLAGDHDAVRELADVALGLRTRGAASTSALPVFRVLAEIGERERIQALQRTLGDGPGPINETTTTFARGLVARLDGDAATASELHHRAEQGLSALGRRYEAACVALEVARALEGAGDTAGAQAARERASAVLEPLGCVNPW